MRKFSRSTWLWMTLLMASVGAGLYHSRVLAKAPDVDQRGAAPVFQVDPFWPKTLPNNWILGPVSGIAIDSRDHVWIAQRPTELAPDERGAAATPPTSECCIPAPPIIEFDPAGNVVQAWGGPGAGYEWPKREHGLFVDARNNVWLSGAGDKDAQVLKFTTTGKFLLQIGKYGQTLGSNDRNTLGKPSSIGVDVTTNEVFIADGEVNHRVIVFNADTGAYKRHWGAYGKVPDDKAVVKYDPTKPPSAQFGDVAVHCVRLAKDGLVYVCDRVNNRIQVFRRDGTFVKEVVVAKNTLGLGSVWDVNLSPDERFLYVADGVNKKVWILTRDDLAIVGSFGHGGRNAGQFYWVQALAVDSRGTIYTAEVSEGKRVQKFVKR